MAMIVAGLLFIYYLMMANAEWVAITSEPLVREIPGDVAVNLSIAWKEESNPRKAISLTLTRNNDFQRTIPLYSLDEKDGKVKQMDTAELQGTVFYQDSSKCGAISFTKQTDGRVDMRGSFAHGGNMYRIEPYHPRIHKRRAEIGDHLILKRETIGINNTDYVLPKPGTVQSEILEQSRKLYKSIKGSSVRALSLAATTYQVQLYILVDSYLYSKLSSVSQYLQWSAGVDNFVAYYMSHLANEVDIVYRGIPSTTLSISTVLSYIYVAKTAASNLYSSGLVNRAESQADAGALLDALESWVTRNRASLPSDADHYMLQTSLDLTYQGSSENAGLASVGGACLDSPVSVNEYQSSTTAAHELGHNLGAEHDGEGNTCNGTHLYVMAAVGGSTSGSTIGNPWKFSSCSLDYFKSFIQTLNSQGKNCLVNKGTYISSWENDSTRKLGQDISPDRQCQMFHGDGYSFIGGAEHINVLCHQLFCIELATGKTESNRPALQYTTCGNKAWCDKERCVNDTNAPSADSSCPFGDKKGKVYSNSDATCSNITGVDCYNPNVQSACCSACKRFKTGMTGCEYGDKASWCSTQNYPTTCNLNDATCCSSCQPYATAWLGGACPYGDKASWCATLALDDCKLNKETCCQKCCTVNCTQPPTTTAKTTQTTTVLGAAGQSTSLMTTTSGATGPSMISMRFFKPFTFLFFFLKFCLAG